MTPVHKLDWIEFGVKRDNYINTILDDYGGVPDWLSKSLEMVVSRIEGDIPFDCNEDNGSSILLESVDILGWDYVDDGEYAIVKFPKTGMSLFISRETGNPNYNAEARIRKI